MAGAATRPSALGFGAAGRLAAASAQARRFRRLCRLATHFIGRRRSGTGTATAASAPPRDGAHHDARPLPPVRFGGGNPHDYRIGRFRRQHRPVIQPSILHRHVRHARRRIFAAAATFGRCGHGQGGRFRVERVVRFGFDFRLSGKR